MSAIINQFCEQLKDDIIDSFATEIKNRDNGKEIKTINKLAREYVNDKWQTEKWSLAPGKILLAKIFSWVAENHKVSLNKFLIAREIYLSEIDSEIIKVISCIENKTDF